MASNNNNNNNADAKQLNSKIDAIIKNLEDKKTDRKLLADSLTEMAKKIGA